MIRIGGNKWIGYNFMESEMSEIDRSELVMESEINNSKGNFRFVVERAKGQSIEDASTAAGFSKSTGLRRMKNPEVKAAIQQTRALLFEQTVAFTALHLSDTLQTVKDIKDKGASDSVKLSAAKAILQIAMAQMKQLDLSGEDESPVEQEKQLNFRALNAEELKLFLALMAKMKGEDESEF